MQKLVNFSLRKNSLKYRESLSIQILSIYLTFSLVFDTFEELKESFFFYLFDSYFLEFIWEKMKKENKSVASSVFPT